MDEIIRRLRNEPALVAGIVTTVVTFIMALVTGGGTLVTLLPVLVSAILRQFVSPAVPENIILAHKVTRRVVK